MKTMKGLSMKGMMGGIKKRTTSSDAESTQSQVDNPEANAVRSAKLYCESRSHENNGSEVLHLPVIVEAAESSPSAAKECCAVVKKYLCQDNAGQSYVQYNAIVLFRILIDNPGRSFTRNIDAKFVQEAKNVLKYSRDTIVQQLLRETLHTIDIEKSLLDENLIGLKEMWLKYQEKAQRNDEKKNNHAPPGRRSRNNAPLMLSDPNFPRSQNHYGTQLQPQPQPQPQQRSLNALPAPHELSSRIEEAQTSATILMQLCDSTGPADFEGNELLQEFTARCTTASRSIQNFIKADNPPPDNDTMLTLIETNDQLSLAQSKYSRSLLQARKMMGAGGTPPLMTSANGQSNDSAYAPPSGPPPPSKNGKGRAVDHESLYARHDSDNISSASNPFADPIAPPSDESGAGPSKSKGKSKEFVWPQDGNSPTGQFDDHLGVEPYHPGFNSTNSYIQRQDSTVNGMKMSSAIQTDGGSDDGLVAQEKGKGLLV